MGRSTQLIVLSFNLRAGPSFCPRRITDRFSALPLRPSAVSFRPGLRPGPPVRPRNDAETLPLLLRDVWTWTVVEVIR